ncbi:MAG: hypothetical protein ACMG57_02770 [Candidatus Dojkabacteria bacterium]
MRNIKRFFIFLLTAITITGLFATKLFATSGQWSATGSTIYYNDGNIGLGATNLPAKLGLSNAPGVTWAMFQQNNYNSKYYIHDSADGLKMEMAVYDGTNGQTHWNVLSIVRNGDIQMGLTNDQVNLFVNGSITTRALTVTATGWPDFVFATGYKLKQLSDVEKFISDNKHLPDVPSEDQIIKNGINVADIQKTQMQKIEELTLYAIQQDKKLNNLETRLNKLESLILN